MFHVKRLIIFLLLFIPFISFAQLSTSTLEVKPIPPLPGRESMIESFLLKSEIYKAASPEVKDWFYWTNYSRVHPKEFYEEVVMLMLKTFPNLNSSYSKSLKKDLYSGSTLPLISPNTILMGTAQKHADDLAGKKASPSHNSTNGTSFQDRLVGAGVKKCAGENLSFGPGNAALALVLLYIDQGLPAVGHRKSLLNPSYVQMGVGISRYPDNNLMVVQDFACEQ